MHSDKNYWQKIDDKAKRKRVLEARAAQEAQRLALKQDAQNAELGIHPKEKEIEKLEPTLVEKKLIQT